MAFGSDSKVVTKRIGQLITEQFNVLPAGADLAGLALNKANGEVIALGIDGDDTITMAVTYTK